MSALERLKQDWARPGSFDVPSSATLVFKRDLVLALTALDAAQRLHESAHNGNLYAKEYNALTEALTALCAYGD